ncbi:Cystathionine beta-lyase metC [Kluyvera cryocrescens]|uniref:Cystathionine beta-lyase metC n=1 Tax=Kluyvera cryocrescens TaxID=580 RepID=A0A485ATM9_KLUCR|nr:Cystathionine beta-lyase metC [Kluyvera cryocrescens]
MPACSQKWALETTYYDPCIGAAIETLFRPNTTTLFLESPGSQSFEIQDVPAMTRAAKAHGVTTIIDNTWGDADFLPRP